MDLFAHRIHKAEFFNGIVRLECSVIRPDETGNFDPNAAVPPEEVSFTVNMPLQGFMRSLSEMRELAADLQKKGVLRGPEQGRAGGAPGQGGDPRANRMRDQKRLQDLTQDDDGDDDQLV